MAAKLDFQKLKDIRVEKDITQKILAETTGINQNTLKSIETGRITSDKATIKKLTDELGLNIDDVYIENYHCTKVICTINNKGGSGKTSVCGSLGYALSEQGNKILFIDSDMQMNLTHSFGLGKNSKNLGRALMRDESLLDYILKTKFPLIDIIISDLSMSTIEMSLFPKMHRETILKNILLPIIELGIYDYILIDTNPTLAILNLNVVNASNFCIIPVTADSFGVENIKTVLQFIKDAQKYNRDLKGAKILLNKYDIRNKTITLQCEAFVRKNYSNLLFDTIISIDNNLQKAQMNNVPVLEFKTDSRISQEYRTLCKEIIKNVK